MNRKIIVFGATGNTGIKIREELNSQQIKHSVFVRRGSEQKVKTSPSALYAGDALSKTDIEKVLVNQVFSDIIIALGSRDLKASNIRSIGTKNIVEVLNQKSAESKLHVISAHGVGESWGSLKWYEKLITKVFLNKTMKDHDLQESAATYNAGGYHIIRPVALKNGEATGNIIAQSNGPLPNGDITRADLAKYLVDSLVAGKSGISSVCNA